MFEQKVLVRILNCTKFDLREIENFCIKFKKKYGEDVFGKLISDLYEIRHTFFHYNNTMNELWYYLLCHVVKKYIEPQGIKYCYDEFCDLKENFTNPTFRFKYSDFKDLELEFMRAGVNTNVLHKLINDLNYFLER